VSVVTPWSLFEAFGWNGLVTQQQGVLRIGSFRYSRFDYISEKHMSEH